MARAVESTVVDLSSETSWDETRAMVDVARGLRRAARELLPPIVTRALRHGRRAPSGPGFAGSYASFEQASAACPGGYEQAEIIDATITRTAQVRDAARAAPHRVANAWTLQNLAALLTGLGPTPRASLRVLDFGGAVGVHYFTLAPFLAAYGKLDWTVCETGATARAAQEHFATDELRFTSDLDRIAGRFDVVLTSGALQYVPSPRETLGQLTALSDLLVMNRMPLIDAPDRLAVQTTLAGEREVRYPAWFFNADAWIESLTGLGFRVAMRWSAAEDTVTLDDRLIAYQGLLATLKKP